MIKEDQSPVHKKENKTTKKKNRSEEYKTKRKQTQQETKTTKPRTQRNTYNSIELRNIVAYVGRFAGIIRDTSTPPKSSNKMI